MKTGILSIALILLSYQIILAQQPQWRVLPNSPVAGSRFNDCSFININTGWVCTADNANVWKTTNGGLSWIISGNTYYPLRCIYFFDSLNGWAGIYNSANLLRKTNDGGISWEHVNIPSPSETGICGFSSPNDSVLYGCGRYWGPARFIRTFNRGNTWENIDMSAYCSGLVDCHFFSVDTGIVTGRANLSGSSRGIVLQTTNRGDNWDTLFFTVSPVTQWGWKISFPDRLNGFISLERTGGGSVSSSYFLKTTNRGSTWEEKVFLPQIYDEEGIGFINENTGWIGGWENVTYETTNGGNNWYVLNPGENSGSFENINRFRFLNDSTGYAVGSRVYKYSEEIMTSAEPVSGFAVNNFRLYQNYPNPFNSKTRIRLDLSEGMDVKITVHNILGTEVATIIEGDYLAAGNYDFDWDANYFPSGVYYYKISNNYGEQIKSMVLIK